MNLQYVEIDEVYNIHRAIIKNVATKASVRDFSLLHNAVERPKATYQGLDLYPNLFLKAGALLQSLCMNHPFTDGNKRTSWLATKRFLYLNGYHLKAEKKYVVPFMVSVNNEKLDLAAISNWLKRHCMKTK